jgi:hypothetical protein
VTNGTRTRNIQNHNLGLYQLSYGHRPTDRLVFAPGPVKFSARLNREGGFNGTPDNGQPEAGAFRLGRA